MQNYYYVIPTELAENGDTLKALVYGCIVSLTRKEGFCYASNQYIAKKFGVHYKTISDKITELEDEGWIQREVTKKDGNKRKIWLAIRPETDTSESTDGYPRSPETDSYPSTDGHSNIREKDKRELKDIGSTKQKNTDDIWEKNIEPFKDQYDDTMIAHFTDYWRQKNPKGRKELWEKKTTFDFGRRLSMWKRKSFKKKLYETISEEELKNL